MVSTVGARVEAPAAIQARETSTVDGVERLGSLREVGQYGLPVTFRVDDATFVGARVPASERAMALATDLAAVRLDEVLVP